MRIHSYESNIINVFDKHDNQLRRSELSVVSLMLEARMPDTDARSESEADFWRLERRTLSILYALKDATKAQGLRFSFEPR
ncbi:hypothetical protein TRIATDRAFT_297624 [Trichoderma atroviride IMI 206040]|uniref:Uncharacterized protein n=1 Tax=Hypocrea atroviridis (strain ATCC 20476 / IMI 206040) TaxID=452589 RepID=G9NIX1_HYPAI|nr:uncharacterized protein TRIATDRAFT_297624 [Trichoderma atroviride IMI 206040]EHK49728.1 hypothetical protein TRIATDRAFT_297624 [Trichoderma atroviride IMI 206040]